MYTFTAIEGLDASGKCTQTKNLVKFLNESTRKTAVRFDLPKYDSITGEMIKGYLTGDVKIELSQQAKVKLYDRTPAYVSDPGTYLFQCAQLVNRLETLPDGLWDATDDTCYVADRYCASAYAYGLAFDLDLDWLLRIHRHLPKPDVNILLDIPIEESFKRRPERRDAYERDAGMLQKVRECYHRVFGMLGPSYVIVDASGTVDETFSSILDVLEARSLL